MLETHTHPFFSPSVWELFFSRIGQCKSIAFLCSKISTPTTISDFAVLYYFQLLMWCLNVRPHRWICMCFYLLFYQFAIFFFELVSWFEVHYYFVRLGGLRAMFNILSSSTWVFYCVGFQLHLQKILRNLLN